MKQLRAIRALRMNYRRRGVVVWLRGRSGKPTCARWPYRDIEPVKLYGWQRLLYEPERVITEQHAIAEGAYL